MIFEKIKSAALVARKNRDRDMTASLTSLVGEIATVGKTKGNRPTTDEEAIQVVKKFVNNAKYTFEVYSKGITYDEFNKVAVPLEEAVMPYVNKLTKEIKLYESFLPQQMTEEELTREIGIFLGDNASANMGQVMGHLKSKFQGTYDGRMASNITKVILTK